MMLTLKELPKDFNIRFRQSLGWKVLIRTVCLFLFFFALIIITLKPGLLVAIVALVFMAASSHYIRTLYPDWVKEKMFIDTVTFSETEAFDTNASILMQAVKKIEIQHNYYRNATMNRNDITHNGLMRIAFEMEDQRKEFVVLLKNKKEFTAFKELLVSWYRSGMEISEKLHSTRQTSLLLKPTINYSYKDLQTAKSLCGITELRIES